MAAALHDPDQGYYARRIRGVGQRGDFTTTAAISPALGKAIAAWANRTLTSEGCGDLIELGPGEGTLAKSVLGHLPWHRRLRTRLHLVESSATLREKQQRLLGNKVRWHRNIQDALDACDGKACLYSNEFADAFPVRRFRKSGDHWEELSLLPDREVWLPIAELPSSTLFQTPWAEQQVIEVHESYHQWLTQMLPHWRKGRLLTIDYGARDKDLYHRQPGGSLRAYFHHQCLTGSEACARPGHQDLTTDINFSDLLHWSHSATELIALTPQAEFLAPFIDAANPADQYAIDPAGPGTAFLCLDQRRMS
ncbi:SAM-dependent methyltransferase [Haloferula chungangensis]|uniref:SAM-dependent methyltransferase n=1 Tax=Haloferula chungangensis TaxID=1048331 RepID=A0ABW2L2E7_9BACT